MTQEEILKTLTEGPQRFTFLKKDGTVREAYGTRNATVVSEHNATPKGTGIEKNNVITYFDIDKNAWRSFNTESFIEFIEENN